MQEDDENVEVWYLMAVAFNGLRPPDYESARCVRRWQGKEHAHVTLLF